MKRICVLGALAAAVAPTTASAATLQVSDGKIVYAAGQGERNNIRASIDRLTNEMAIEDATGVQLGQGCRTTSGGGASCSLAGVSLISFATGDQADRVDITGLVDKSVDRLVDRAVDTSIDLGPGDDVVDARNGAVDRITAGFGLDSGVLDLRDPLVVDAEILRSLPVEDRPTVDIAGAKAILDRGGRAPIKLRCPRSVRRWCVGGLRLDRVSDEANGSHAPRGLLGDTAFKIPRGQTRVIKVRLTRTARRGLARDDKWLVRAQAVTPGEHGPDTALKLLTLVSP